MIAVDSSTLIAYINGDTGPDVDRFDSVIGNNDIALPPVVLTEVLSQPNLPSGHWQMIREIPLLEIDKDYWLRVAETRKYILSRKLRARLADTLIAQSCIDHDVALITRDTDFRHFAKHCGLKLA
ncbi:MAG TPA: PIN domain-containing protein [Rhizomicrobium sp.]|jgi:predicted nucleic acid-binding protein|nr:PIN domain-containing protein [Rhizomicrobium sp.]